MKPRSAKALTVEQQKEAPFLNVPETKANGTTPASAHLFYFDEDGKALEQEKAEQI